MSAFAALDVVAAGAVAFGAIGCAAAWRMHRRSRADRQALVLAVQAQGRFIEATRRLSGAAGISVEAVREELVRAVHVLAPAIDVVLFFEEHHAELVCVAADGSRVEFFGGTRVALDDGGSPIALALERGHRVSLRDVAALRRLHPGDRFATAIPLLLDAGRRCVVYLASDSENCAAEAERVGQIVDQAASAYGIALERADDRARAQYDGLTGLLTPRALRTKLAALIERARFAPLGRVGLLFVDTDCFKQWNDSYGHASGDALLRELAQLLLAVATDPRDVVARNGGDEFCVVFADGEKSSAIERAERLRASIAETNFSGLHAHAPGVQEVRISASIGVACFPVDAQSPQALLQKSDEAMYHSKKTGRNGVSFFGVDTILVRADGATEERTADRRRE